MEPRRPIHPPEYAQVCLQALADQGLGDKISLGGAFGLMHYSEYRLTHDIDAWWQLRRRRQELANSDTDLARARLAVLTHMARIEQHRPLDNIADDSARAEAERVRIWFKGVFVNALS